MAHDIFPFVNVFVVTNILTRNYHEFLHFLILSQYIIQSMIKEKELKGVKFDTDKDKANTNYTINGMVSGKFTAKATNILTGNVINFDYIWEGVQLAGGEDSTDPTTKRQAYEIGKDVLAKCYGGDITRKKKGKKMTFFTQAYP